MHFLSVPRLRASGSVIRAEREKCRRGFAPVGRVSGCTVKSAVTVAYVANAEGFCSFPVLHICIAESYLCQYCFVYSRLFVPAFVFVNNVFGVPGLELILMVRIPAHRKHFERIDINEKV